MCGRKRLISATLRSTGSKIETPPLIADESTQPSQEGVRLTQVLDRVVDPQYPASQATPRELATERGGALLICRHAQQRKPIVINLHHRSELPLVGTRE